jgi:hypothetical protein
MTSGHHPARRSTRDLAAGLLLGVIGLAGLLVADDRFRTLLPGTPALPAPLSSAHGAYLGGGSFPIALFVLLLAIGAAMALLALVVPGERLAAWRLRPMLLILAAVFLFGATIRPLGLVVAGPVAIVLSSLATTGWKWWELVSSAVATTAASIFVFAVMLRLPIPIAPWLGW